MYGMNTGASKGYVDAKAAENAASIANLTQQIFGQANTLAELGDSITVRDSPSVSGAATSLLASGYFNWANIFLNQAFNVISKNGVSGDTTVDILARIDADTIAKKPAYCMLLAGINDIQQYQPTAAVLQGRLEQIYDKLSVAGIRIITSTIMPSNVLDSAEKLATFYAVNDWIRRYAQNHPNIIFADMAAVLSDGTTSAPKAGYTDGTHQYAKGAIRMGKSLADKIRPHIKMIDHLPFTNADPLNLWSNGMMLGDTSGAADGITVLTGAGAEQTQSKVPSTDDIPAEWQVVDITTQGTALSTIASSVFNNTLSVGDKACLEIEFKVENITTLKQFYADFMMLDSTAATTIARAYTPYPDGQDLDYMANFSGVLKTEPITVTETVAKLRWKVYMWGKAKFSIRRVKISKVVE